MTIRQISEAAGCSIITVRRVGKMMFPDVKAESRGMAIDYDREQSIQIMNRLPKKNYVNNPTQMITPPLSNDQPSTLTKKDLEMIGAIVGHVMNSLDKRVSLIENIVEERKELLPSVNLTPRAKLNKVINEFAVISFGGDHREAWNALYQDIYYRLHKNVRVCAKNAGLSKIDYIEQEGLIETAISIVIELMGE